MNDLTSRTPAAAEGLHGLWWFAPLRRLALRAGASTTLVMAISISLHLLLYYLLPGDNVAITGAPDARDLFYLYLGAGMISGGYYVIPYVFLPFIEKLLHGNLGDLLPDNRALLRPGWKSYARNAGAMLIIALVMFNLITWSFGGITWHSSEMLALPTGLLVFMWLVMPLQAIMVIPCFGALDQAGRFMQDSASKVEIKLLDLQRYSCIAIPLVTVLIYLSILLGTTGVVITFATGQIKDALTWVLILVAPLSLLILPPLFLPVWTLRSRIASRIEAERHMTRAALSGKPDALEGSLLGNRQANPTEAELFTRLMFIDSLPTWPVGPNLQRLIVFGLLPPVAWVLAAVVENTLY